MARYEVSFRSKTTEVPGKQLIREFGGMEPPGKPSYQFEFVKFQARDEAQALRKARRIAKEKNMALFLITKTVWKKRNNYLFS